VNGRVVPSLSEIKYEQDDDVDVVVWGGVRDMTVEGASSISHSKDRGHEEKAARSVRTSVKALKVGAVAKRLGVSATMVRSLEKLGLAKPARSQNKYRLYTNDDLRVLRRAIYLRRVQGLNAPAILKQMKKSSSMTLKPCSLRQGAGQLPVPKGW